MAIGKPAYRALDARSPTPLDLNTRRFSRRGRSPRIACGAAGRRRQQRRVAMKPNPAVWFEIYVQELGRAKKFYESVFQDKLEKLNSPGIEMWAFPMEMNASGAGGALVKMQGVPSGGNSTLVYFGCENCTVEEGRVVKSGGGIH